MIIIAGGGVIGLHVGIALARIPGHPPIAVCERERSVGVHASGRNSQVIHAGVAYPAGSLKAITCVEGNPLTYEWLRKLCVPHARCGKWIVAFAPRELVSLERVMRTGVECGVPALRAANPDDVTRSEPGCRRFAGALHSGSTGIMDAAAYLGALERYLSAQRDCFFLTPCAVSAVDPDKRIVRTTRGSMTYEVFINAAGLWADDVYGMTGGTRAFRIKPFKGEYYTWRGGPLRTMIYPIPLWYLSGMPPDRCQMSNMGVHVHRSVSGDVFVGPTQVELGWSGKGDYRIVTPRETFVAAAERFAIAVNAESLSPAYAGNRPKLFEDGRPLGDFQVVREGAHVHLLGIESPGLTAAPALARIAARLAADVLA